MERLIKRYHFEQEASKREKAIPFYDFTRDASRRTETKFGRSLGPSLEEFATFARTFDLFLGRRFKPVDVIIRAHVESNTYLVLACYILSLQAECNAI